MRELQPIDRYWYFLDTLRDQSGYTFARIRYASHVFRSVPFEKTNCIGVWFVMTWSVFTTSCARFAQVICFAPARQQLKGKGRQFLSDWFINIYMYISIDSRSLNTAASRSEAATYLYLSSSMRCKDQGGDKIEGFPSTRQPARKYMKIYIESYTINCRRKLWTHVKQTYSIFER